MSYNNGKHVVDLTDSKFGTIVGNGMTTFEWDSIIGAGCAHNSKYKMRISVKDEKVRIMYSGLIGNELTKRSLCRWGLIFSLKAIY